MIRGRRELPFRQETVEKRHYETDASIVGNDGLSVAFLETGIIRPFEDSDRSIVD